MTRLRRTEVEVEGERLERFVVEEESAAPPPAWGVGATLAHVGSPTPRQDGLEKVTGCARYTADVRLPGMLFGKALRSPHPHARVASVDPASALACPGVRCVLTPFDDEVAAIAWYEGEGKLLDRVQRFAGDEVAFVAAETEEAAEDALEALAAGTVFEPLPFVIDPEQAIGPDAPLVHPDGNVIGGAPRVKTRGDVEAGFGAAAATVDLRFRTACALHNALEAHGSVAAWEGDRLLVHDSTQHVYGSRDEIARALGLPLHRVRVVMEHMGGGFGAKQASGKHAVLAAIAARRTGRPCRAFLDRREEDLATGNRAATVQRVRLGARADGTLTAVYLHAVVNVGAYAAWVSPVHGPFRELYRCPNVRTEVVGARTNLGPFGAFRGPGYVQGTFALEQAMDALARKLGVEPLELRLRNLPRSRAAAEAVEAAVAGIATESGSPADDAESSDEEPVTGGDPAACLERAVEVLVRGSGGEEDGESSTSTSTRRGQGVACVVWGGGGGPPAYAVCRINSDATAVVHTGSQDIGTGTRTAMAIIAAEELGIEPDDVRVEMGDTGAGPYAPVSAGSMTLASVGPAVRAAAADARAQMRAIAAEMGDASLSVAGVLERLGDPGFTVVGRGARGPNPDGKAVKTYAAYAAEVVVDEATGAVRVERIAGVHDSGRIVNPLAAASQVEGGAVQGIGHALTEERVVDAATGRVLNADLERYEVPTALDVPLALEARFLDIPDLEANSLGAKGLGEPPLIGAPAAIACAIGDALGTVVTELPVTRERVLRILGERAGARVSP